MSYPYDAVVFDLDGTLVDTTALHIEATQAAHTAVFAAPASREMIIRSLGLPVSDSMAVISNGRGMTMELLQQFMSYYSAHERDGAQCFPDTFALLHRLEATKIPLALLSNKLKQWGRAEVQRLGLGTYFPTMVFMEDMPMPKPAGQAMQPIFRILKVHPERILFIGDGVSDIRCARDAGVSSGAALWGMFDPSPVIAAQPTHQFYAMNEVAQLFGIS